MKHTTLAIVLILFGIFLAGYVLALALAARLPTPAAVSAEASPMPAEAVASPPVSDAGMSSGECRRVGVPAGAGPDMLLCRVDPNPGVRCYYVPKRLGDLQAAFSCVVVEEGR